MNQSDPESPVNIRLVELRYGVGLPRMTLTGTYLWVIIARFSTYQDAHDFIMSSHHADVRILDIP